MATYEMEKIENITTHPLFNSIFRIDKELLARIEQNMRDENYDESQPIIVGTWEGQEEPVCIDGHTRLEAATNAGIEEVAVYPYKFETEEDAFDYAIRLQTNRRNLTDGDLLQCIERIHQSRPRGGDRKSEEAKSTPQSCGNKGGRSAAAKDTADLLNMSARKVEQALTVIMHGSPEIKAAVLGNEMSMNSAYQKTQNQRKQAEQDSSTENSGDQAADKSQKVDQAHEEKGSTFSAAVFISMEHLGALKELGGFVERHLADAIDLYLESRKDQDQQSVGEKDQEDEGEQDHEECVPNVTTSDEEDQGESDDDEYFDPERDIDFDSFKED